MTNRGLFRCTYISAGLLVAALMLGACAASRVGPGAPGQSAQAPRLPALIPQPAAVALSERERLTITTDFVIEVSPGEPDLRRIAHMLADLLRPALDTTLPVRESASVAPAGVVRLEITAESAVRDTDRVDEGYELSVDPTGIRIAARTPAGIFYGVQTLRQLLPASVELRAARPHALSVPVGQIVDRPRFAWRGAMLDVARHFFGVADVKRYIDLLALHKLNRLHLHLSDDQGWRIEIASWPNLTTYGASTAVGGGPGGFYTKADFRELVSYAQDRFITIVPEIDMPGHTNAALASYPELNCDAAAPPLYTGIEVGFSTLCVEKDITYTFIDDVVREMAEVSPAPYFHIGGDEVETLTAEEYARFIERAQAIVHAHGRVAIGWDEILQAPLLPTTIVQHWRPGGTRAPGPGTRLILSPADRIYLDMKYHPETPLGLSWAGHVDVEASYDWDPATLLPHVAEEKILGIEAPLWSETAATMADVEFLAFPRLAGVAEAAWSPQEARRWSDFRLRLGAQAPRWSALGINAYWSPAIDWQR